MATNRKRSGESVICAFEPRSSAQTGELFGLASTSSADGFTPLSVATSPGGLARVLHSVRKAVVGSMDAALKAGARQAKTTVAASIVGTAAKVTKSNVET